ncbi:hypothetical protein [Urinicoccus massiliensis]|uniref:hypothetical protein n=1 Tax=Urinicoccus massiliensis TaxID=1723382 RepID=UPI000931DE57|nr:hypothetical protein [Urinicoccus massiliensis]
MKKTVAVLGILSLALIGGNAIYGTEKDPVVTVSYLNEKLAQLKNTGGAGMASTGSEMKLVELKAGDRIIAAAGSELILRSGEATAIATDLGGLSDLTKGKDIKHARQVERDHLLVIPRSDGRGLLAKTSALVLVRGSYSVK